MEMLFKQKYDWVLVSSSIRRREILSRIGFKFDIFYPLIEETPLENEKPKNYIKRILQEKYNYFISRSNFSGVIIAADTIVVKDNQILGKPKTVNKNFEMLKFLNGSTHSVQTGIYLYCSQTNETVVDIISTTVTFFEFKNAILENYALTREGLDKSGGYSLQGKSGFLVKSIHGSHFNVMGFPLSIFVQKCLEKGWIE